MDYMEKHAGFMKYSFRNNTIKYGVKNYGTKHLSSCHGVREVRIIEISIADKIEYRNIEYACEKIDLRIK